MTGAQGMGRKAQLLGAETQRRVPESEVWAGQGRCSQRNRTRDPAFTCRYVYAHTRTQLISCKDLACTVVGAGGSEMLGETSRLGHRLEPMLQSPGRIPSLRDLTFALTA